MKLLSVAIPRYSSENYMRHCIDSLLVGGDEVEIIIMDDGSTKGRTAQIAGEYEREYPSICRAIHQENGDHGEAVNIGLHNATDILYKVADNDDWVDEEAFHEVLCTPRCLVYGNQTLDILISNFAYEKKGTKRKKVVNYNTALPKNGVITWSDVKLLMLGQYIPTHSVIYQTELLRECGLESPKHTFYVDNIFVHQPLPHVKTMYYLDVNFYRYYIGREDQSVNESVMIGRVDQQIRVTKLMLDYYDVTKIQNRKSRHYTIQYLEIMMVVSSILAIRSSTEKNLAKKKELRQYLRQSNFAPFMCLHWGLSGQGVNLPGKGERQLTTAGHKITRKFYGSNQYKNESLAGVRTCQIF